MVNAIHVVKGQSQQPIDLLSFQPTIGPAIPEIQPFQYLTLKIQGQGHGRGQN